MKNQKLKKKIIENDKRIILGYNRIIKLYEKLFRGYHLLVIFSQFFWFWLGYLYGFNNWIITALVVQIIIAIMYIVGELVSK